MLLVVPRGRDGGHCQSSFSLGRLLNGKLGYTLKAIDVMQLADTLIPSLMGVHIAGRIGA